MFVENVVPSKSCSRMTPKVFSEGSPGNGCVIYGELIRVGKFSGKIHSISFAFINSNKPYLTLLYK